METFLSGSQTALSIVQGCLVVPLQADLYDDLLDRVRGDILAKVYSKTVKGIVFDMGSVQVIDTYVFNHLVDTAKMTLLLGVAAVFVGFQPGVVSALVDLDIDPTTVKSYRTVEEALEYFTSGFSSHQGDREDEKNEHSHSEDDGWNRTMDGNKPDA